MKKLLTACLPVLLASGALVSCDQQSSSPEQLRLTHEKNAAIRAQIDECRSLLDQWDRCIQRKGEDTPNLKELVEEKERNLAADLSHESKMKDKLKEKKLRVLQLQDRLESFRDTFRTLQNDVSNSRS